MEKEPNQELPIYRICPDCHRDILEHDEAIEYIKKHAERHKRKIELNRTNLTTELFKKYLEEELVTRSKEIEQQERCAMDPFHDTPKKGIIMLESWKNINQIYKDELEPKPKNSKPKSLTWQNLFKDPKQADKILILLSEYLSSTGEWTAGKAGRYLVALCTELEKKGYFKKDSAITNPIKAAAFNKQFGVNLSAKIFQPEERNKAEDYREYFNHFPIYNP